MASYTDQQLFGAIQPHLQPGENVVSVAYGNKQAPFWAYIIFIPFALVGVLFIALIWLLTNKNFVVALTDRRLIVAEVSGLAAKHVRSYPLPIQGRVVAQPKGPAYRIELQTPIPFAANFFRNAGPTNFQNAQTIGQMLLAGGQMQGAAGPGGPGMGAPQLGGPAPQQLPGGHAPQLPPQGGWGAPPGGPPPGGGYGPPPQGGGYGPPPQGGGYGGPPQGGGYGGPPPQGGGYGGPPPQGGGHGGPPPGGYGPPGGQGGPGQGGPGQGGPGQGGWGQG